MKASSPPSVSEPRESSHVPTPTMRESSCELDELDDRAVDRFQPRRGELRDQASLSLSPKAFHLGGLAVVRLHELDVRKALLDDRAHRAAPATDLPGSGAAQAREPPAGDEEDRCDGQRQNREIPLEVEQEAGKDRDPQQVAEGRRDPGEHQILDRLDVVGQPRDHVAEPAALEEVERKVLDVPEDVRAQVEDEALADQRREVVVEKRGDAAGERQPDVRGCDPREGTEVVRDENVVDQVLEDENARRGHGRRHRHEQQHQQQGSAIRACERPEPADDRRDRQRRRLGADPRALGLRSQLPEEPAPHALRREQAHQQGDRRAEQDVEERPQPRRRVRRVELVEPGNSAGRTLCGVGELPAGGRSAGIAVSLRRRGFEPEERPAQEGWSRASLRSGTVRACRSGSGSCPVPSTVH